MPTERAASVREVEQSSSERVFIFYESSTHPMIFTKKVLFKGPKTVAVADCHCNCCHWNRSSLYQFPSLPSCTPSLKLFECAEDEGRRGDDDDEEREEGGDLRGTLIKNS